MGTALGDFLICLSGGAAAAELPAPALDAAAWPAVNGAVPALTVLRPAPGVSVVLSGDVRYVTAGDRGGVGLARVPEQAGAGPAPAAAAEAGLQAWIARSDWTPASQRGRFVYVCWDTQARELQAFTDLFRTHPVYYCSTPEGLLCASDLRLVLNALRDKPAVDPVAVYHYLNFAYIPSPRTAVAGVSKLEPGSRLAWRDGRTSVQRFADARYPEDLRGSDADLARELRERIVRNVADYRPTPGTAWGTYLSGGTDSSSIAGILARASASTPVDSFSIGFGEGAYDELNYSRIAVRHFGLSPHERVVGEADSVALVPRLVRGFDEPFGNSSAIPTFYCANLAQGEGKQLLIAGDGGDEIFGGNERYAKDQVFRWFHDAPGIVRGGGRLLAAMLRGMDSHWANRIKNMVHRGLMPNPDRFYSDDSFASDHFDDMLASDFRARVDRDDSLNVQREIFARAGTRSELHKLMYLDLQMTIAESDVVKVVRSAKMAGIDVAFPYLDADLVAYTGRLPDRCKVRVLKKRHLFKLAMADILPVEIIKKKKQGFGLPIAVWMREKGAMRELVNDVLGSSRARERGYVQPAFVQQLLDTHERGSWDYASEIFRLLMLELWHREYLDGHA